MRGRGQRRGGKDGEGSGFLHDFSELFVDGNAG
jgi:hypothetical protein